MTTSGLGGYPKTRISPGGALDRLFDAHKNLWGDLSAGSGANAIGRDRSSAAASCSAGPTACSSAPTT